MLHSGKILFWKWDNFNLKCENSVKKFILKHWLHFMKSFYCTVYWSSNSYSKLLLFMKCKWDRHEIKIYQTKYNYHEKAVLMVRRKKFSKIGALDNKK